MIMILVDAFRVILFFSLLSEDIHEGSPYIREVESVKSVA